MKVSQITWTEPNRAGTPPLHIASRGERFSTVTGVWWIDEFRFVANHRSGLRVALFDIRQPERPVAVGEVPHLSDDVAARRIGENTWEIAVSGCWAVACSIFHLTIGDDTRFHWVSTTDRKDMTFSHGVAFGKAGALCLTFHTGENPRIEIGDKCWRLPEPWGARDVCYDEVSDTYYAVAVSANPQRIAYEKTSTSVWKLDANSDDWQMIEEAQGMHSDACQVYKGRLWLPNQHSDGVVAFGLNGATSIPLISGDGFDFPHGLGVSEQGILAVTNYGNSTITLLDISQL